MHILTDTLLADWIGAGTLGVNSYHHQTIQPLAPPLRQAAISEDGLIEASYLPNEKFVLAIQ